MTLDMLVTRLRVSETVFEMQVQSYLIQITIIVQLKGKISDFILNQEIIKVLTFLLRTVDMPCFS